MRIKNRHRQAARAFWEAGGRLAKVAESGPASAETLRRWLAEPAFRALLAQQAVEPLLQATSAVLQWAPVAVARLIRDLDGESASDARQAAREILKLATEAQRAIATPDAPGGPPSEPAPGALVLLADDPLVRRISRLSDEQVAGIFGILNGAEGGQ